MSPAVLTWIAVVALVVGALVVLAFFLWPQD